MLRFFTAWFSKVFRSVVRSNCACRSRRLTVERLEEREVPAFLWTGNAGDGLWSNAANWFDDVANMAAAAGPGAATDVKFLNGREEKGVGSRIALAPLKRAQSLFAPLVLSVAGAAGR